MKVEKKELINDITFIPDCINIDVEVFFCNYPLPSLRGKVGFLQSKKVGRVAPPDELFSWITRFNGSVSTPQSPLWR
jgi:hypothetical protein